MADMKIFVIDGREVPNPEDLSMLQALYSRSAASVVEHMEKVKKTGSARFCESFLVNYGHKSIADCGSTTLFIEGVSLLAAKAIQDWPLYCGQETSTRYIDMSRQPIVDPVGTSASKVILDRWMDFYGSNQDRVAKTIARRHPMRPGEDEKKYNGAVKARTFDVLRGFLPAGIKTQLSWHSNLRQFGDHLLGLCHHPAAEIADIGKAIRSGLAESYPSSGLGMSLPSVSGVGKTDGAEAREAWDARVSRDWSYDGLFRSVDPGFHSTIETPIPSRYLDMISSRPRGAVLPHFLTDLGQLSFRFNLDFGSFRDLQRHRNGVCRMPLLRLHNFVQWYVDQLDDVLSHEAEALVAEQRAAIEKLTSDQVAKQYYAALGFEVPCRVTYALPAAVYVMELRSGKMIHPTLRTVVHSMIRQFSERYPEIPLHVDMDPDDWDVRRGAQTITEKK